MNYINLLPIFHIILYDSYSVSWFRTISRPSMIEILVEIKIELLDSSILPLFLASRFLVKLLVSFIFHQTFIAREKKTENRKD